MAAEDRERYRAACHAVQTGVAYMLERGSSEGTPKHLRVGVNVALCDNSALAKLLIAKGVITLDEYEWAIAEEAEAEVKRYELRLKEAYGVDITLG